MTEAPRLGLVAARRLVDAAGALPPLAFTLAASGQLDPLLLYLRAHLAQAGRRAGIAVLPFGTLGQWLRRPAEPAPELLLALPWDFVGELDWRSGIPAAAPDHESCLAAAAATADLLRRRPRLALAYLPAPLPPIFADPAQGEALARHLTALAVELGAALLPAEGFALAPFLAAGCPVGGAATGAVAARLAGLAAGLAAPPPAEPAKVLVTDLDNVLWHGVIAEDGPAGVGAGPEGLGWRHFLYQTLLKRLRGEGVVVVAVSRNRPEDVLAPLRSGEMVLGEEDFVAIIASYQAKSAQIRGVARELNLTLDSFVFVDDNPIELAEVASELPEVRCRRFPDSEAALPGFLAALSAEFRRAAVTDEDRRRTALYRQRLAAMLPAEAEGADLTAFLRGLDMRLRLRDRSRGERGRAVQLINKTNQFNLDGRRWSDAEVGALLDAGGRLFAAELLDRTGSHGEVIVLLVGPDGVAEAMVMSCRVFLRRAEHRFLIALAEAGVAPRRFRHAVTPRNEPSTSFLADPAFTPAGDGLLDFDAAGFARAHAEIGGLIAVEWA